MPSLYNNKLSEQKKPSEAEERRKMKTYWNNYRKPSLESMMLSHDAKYLAEDEQSELLSYLPSYDGLKLLELGAGIGRFTSRFAQTADHVTAVDFIDAYLEENKKQNDKRKNIRYICADVTKLEFEENSFDMIFTNWLFMYLTNDEVAKVFSKILKWLAPNGHFFIRESCYHPSGNVKRKENPTKYRTPYDYFKMLNKCSLDKHHFNIIFAKNVLTYIQYYGNPNQICMLIQKESGKMDRNVDDPCNPVAASLYHHQLLGPIFRDEGEHSLQIIGEKLGLKHGKRVLTIGCEFGDVARQLVDRFNCSVHVLGISFEKIYSAIERQSKLSSETKKKIHFEYSGDFPTNLYLPLEAYDAILCADIFHRASFSVKLLIKILKVSLKTEGRLAFLDYFAREPISGDHPPPTTLGEKEFMTLLNNEELRIQHLESDNQYALDVLIERRAMQTPPEVDQVDTKFFLDQLDFKISTLEDGLIKWTKIFTFK